MLLDKDKGVRSAVCFIDGKLVGNVDLAETLLKDPEAFKCHWKWILLGAHKKFGALHDSCAEVMSEIQTAAPIPDGFYILGTSMTMGIAKENGFRMPRDKIVFDIEERTKYKYGDDIVRHHRIIAYPSFALPNVLDFINAVKDIQFENNHECRKCKSFSSIVNKILVPKCSGMHRDDILEWLETHPEVLYRDKSKYTLTPEERYEWDHGIVLKIDRPEIRRETGNTNKKTFDFVRVEMSIRSTYQSVEKLRAHKKEIIQKALDKIDSYKPYQKYGVPVKYLHLYRMTLLQCGDLILDFEVPKATDILKGEE
jgi:hypothetical protein